MSGQAGRAIVQVARPEARRSLTEFRSSTTLDPGFKLRPDLVTGQPSGTRPLILNPKAEVSARICLLAPDFSASTSLFENENALIISNRLRFSQPYGSTLRHQCASHVIQVVILGSRFGINSKAIICRRSGLRTGHLGDARQARRNTDVRRASCFLSNAFYTLTNKSFGYNAISKKLGPSETQAQTERVSPR